MRRHIPAPCLTSCPLHWVLISSVALQGWDPPACHTPTFCPALSRPLQPSSLLHPSGGPAWGTHRFQTSQAGLGTFSEHSQETPLGILIHLGGEPSAFLATAQDGEGCKTREAATCLLGGAGSGRKGEWKQGRFTSSLFAPPSCAEGKGQFGAAGKGDFRGNLIRHKHC